MSETRDFVFGLMLGGLLGVGAGMLLAPDSGENTRRKIKTQAQHMAEEVKDSAGEFTVKLKDGAEEVMRRAKEHMPSDFVESSLEKAEKKLGQLEDQLESRS